MDCTHCTWNSLKWFFFSSNERTSKTDRKKIHVRQCIWRFYLRLSTFQMNWWYIELGNRIQYRVISQTIYQCIQYYGYILLIVSVINCSQFSWEFIANIYMCTSTFIQFTQSRFIKYFKNMHINSVEHFSSPHISKRISIMSSNVYFFMTCVGSQAEELVWLWRW